METPMLKQTKKDGKTLTHMTKKKNLQEGVGWGIISER